MRFILLLSQKAPGYDIRGRVDAKEGEGVSGVHFLLYPKDAADKSFDCPNVEVDLERLDRYITIVSNDF